MDLNPMGPMLRFLLSSPLTTCLELPPWFGIGLMFNIYSVHQVSLLHLIVHYQTKLHIGRETGNCAAELSCDTVSEGLN